MSDSLNDTPAEDEAAIEELLRFLRDSRSLDFTGYKRQSLTRRIRKRMEVVDAATLTEYRDVLEANPREHVELVDTILINVTGFFRDADAWTYLADEVVPAIVEASSDGAPIRIWSAGCATGEEAYTLAMVFAQHLGIDEFKTRVKIYATDTDDAALVVGRTGRYTERQLEPVPPELRARFFEPSGDQYQFRSDCRRSVIFGRHDITVDAPISRLDLLVCRNVLMYLVRDTQRGVLGRFHYALGETGYLFLGKAETIFAHADLFVATSPRYRVFRSSPQPARPYRPMGTAAVPAVPGDEDRQQLRELAAAASPVAQLVVDVTGTLVDGNRKATVMFGITQADLGRPFRDLDVSFRPIELRSRIEQAYAESRPVILRNIERPIVEGHPQFLEVAIAPLLDPGGVALGASITFQDVSELGRTKAELERSAGELALSNESLHSANEELETSNEELQSTNEELETTNEELQSANEELETMNEELQSANEELETMNEELVDQSLQIEQSELFLTTLLNSLAVGVVVVDARFEVVTWNRAMEDRFGLRSEEVVGHSLLALDIGLPVGEIGPLLHSSAREDASGPGNVVLDAVNRTGRPFKCRVTVDRLTNGRGPEAGAPREFVVLMDELPAVPL